MAAQHLQEGQLGASLAPMQRPPSGLSARLLVLNRRFGAGSRGFADHGPFKAVDLQGEHKTGNVA